MLPRKLTVSSNEPMPTTRIVIILLIAAGILESAICVAAHSLGRRRGEASVAQVQSQADADRKESADRLAIAERDNAELVNQLELAKANFDEQAKKLAAAEKESQRLRHDLDDAAKKIADLTQNQKYAAARIKRAEDAAAEARDEERKARLVADTVKRETAKRDTAATVAKAEAAKADVARAAGAARGQRNANNNKLAGGKRRGPVASLPRTSPSFSELDKDNDGRLSLKEYKAGFPDVTDIEEEFKALDTNGDGYLSIDEYKVGHPDPPVVHIARPKRN
jgi:hypothetical protein